MTPSDPLRGSQGISLDPWFSHYADRTAGLSASEVRALFAVASRPEVVSLAGGMPFVSALSTEVMTETVGRVLAQQGATALQYGGGQGIVELREQILQIMALEGIRGSADDIVVTTGSQQALDLVTKLFVDPGDVVLAESPSYVGALGVFRSYQADVEHLAMDAEGIVPAALEETIVSLRAAGRTIKLLYTIPNFHNPAGTTMSWQRRTEILEITRRHEVLVMEDNPYGQLYFDKPAPQAMRSIEDEGVVYLGSFSKTLAPGFRVGWALAPHAIREKLILAAESAILSPSVFNQMIISEYLNSVDWNAQVDTFRGVYRERKEAMIGALREYLPKLSWTDPDGGFFVWLTLPEHLDSKAMLPRAVKELVAYTPGTAFYANGGGRNNMRLAFCYPEPDYLREGIRRLASVINGEIELHQTFSQTGPLRSTEARHSVVAPPPNLS